MELKYCLVTQNIASVVEDSLTDGDRLPDIELASGDVTFIPNVPTGGSYQIELTNGQWYSVPLGRIRAKIVNGKIYHEGKPGVYLYAAGSGSNPSKISYNVSYSNLRAGGVPFSLNSFTFQAVPDGEVDLTLVKPVPGVSPAGTIRGPRGTSLESIEVDDSHLVFTTVNEAGSFEMARIPISHVVEAEAREAARQAAEGVAAITASNLEDSENFKNQAGAHAVRAETAADNTVADARAQLVGYVESAQTSATSADASDKSAAAHRAAAKTSETNAKSSETKAKASETKATTEANRSETARTGSEAAQGKAESAAVKAEGMRDSAAAHSASAERSKTAASQSASEAKASETRAQELADAFDVEGLRAEIEARIADLVDGAPDALNTLREIAELASSNKTVQEQLTEAIAGKADKVHTHSQSQVTGLSTALNNKADKTHTHETSQVVGLDNALAGKADKSHTHAQGDITGLSAALSNKADKTHTHTQAQVTGLSTALSGKANTSHEHQASEVRGLLTTSETSIIPRDTDTGRQVWSNHNGIELGDPAGAPPSGERYYVRQAGTLYPKFSGLFVDSELRYFFSVWVKADKPGSRLSISMSDQDLTTGIQKGIYGNNSVVFSQIDISTEWERKEGIITFREGVREVGQLNLFFNQSTGEVQDATQMISDITLIPIPNHTHTSADITDATERLGRVSDYDTAGKLVRTNADGQLTVYTSSVTGDASVANKNYVDIEVAKKANTSHTHTQAQVTGLSTALNGKAAKSHTHAISDITDLQAELDSKPTHNTMNSGLNGKANKSHTHSQSDITGLSTTLSGKADSTHTHTQGEVTGLTTALNGKAAKSHTHSQSQITGLSTALSGKAAKSHTHAISDVTDLQAELDSKPTHSTMNSGLNGKADKSHTHSQSQVTGLSTALNGKADKSHTHTQGEVTGLTTALNGKADKTHKHTTADITNFATELGKKANTSHTHTQAQVTGLSTALNAKANKTYVDSRPALFSGVGAPPSSISGAVVGDFWLDTSTMELHKITGV